ncbi:MAG: MFS transporter [Actinomycetota bacterium]
MSEVVEQVEDLASARPPERRVGVRQAFSALGHRDFRRFWTGAAVSNIGTWMQNVTVPYVILLITGSATWVGIAAFSQLFPTVLLGPVSGYLADRFDRRRLLILGQGAQAALSLLVWWAWVAGLRDPRLLVGLLALNGAAFGVTMPSWQAFVTELVPRRDLLNAVTLNSAQFNGARAVGPAVGGLVLASFGPSWAFLANAMSYVTVIVALLLVHPPPRLRAVSERRILGQFADGLSYVRRHPGLVVAVVTVGIVFLLGSPIFQLVPVFAERVYRVGPSRYGLLGAAYGIGAVAGAVVLGFVGDRVRRSRVVVAALVLYGSALVGMGLVRSYGAGFVLLTVSGLAFLAIIAVLNTSMQLLVAEHVRGRVIAIYMMTLTGSYPIGALLQGWLTDRIGAPATVLISGSLLVLVGLVMAFRPAIPRSLDGHAHRHDPLPDPTVEADTAL